MLSLSIVLFQHQRAELQGLLQELDSCPVLAKVWLIDNGGSQWAAALAAERPERFAYMDVGRNAGFGAAHNLVLSQLPASVSHHIFCNPDITVTADALEALAGIVQTSDAALIMPHVVYPDGRRQELCKLLPTPLNLFARRFVPWLGDWLDRRYLLRDADYARTFFAPSLSGCFMVCRVDALQAVGGFDERYFMYMEDIDLSRRLADCRYGHPAAGGGAVYVPQVTVVHGFQRGSYNHAGLLRSHIRSAVQYFNKWGWWLDADRRRLNRQCLRDLPRKCA